MRRGDWTELQTSLVGYAESCAAAANNKGHAPVASSLVPLLDGSQLFRNVRFRSPVTRAPQGGLERFDLSFEVAEAVP